MKALLLGALALLLLSSKKASAKSSSKPGGNVELLTVTDAQGRVLVDRTKTPAQAPAITMPVPSAASLAQAAAAAAAMASEMATIKPVIAPTNAKPLPAPMPAPAIKTTPTPSPAAAPPKGPKPIPAGYDPAKARAGAKALAAYLVKKGPNHYSHDELKKWQKLAGVAVDGLYGGTTRGALIFYGVKDPPRPYFKPTNTITYVPPEQRP